MPSGFRRLGVAICSNRSRIMGTWSVQAALCQSKRPSGPSGMSRHHSTHDEKTP